MRIGRVLGTVWGDVKAEGLEPFKLVEVCPLVLGPDGTLIEGEGRVVAVDRLQAGPGDLVLVAHGSRVRDIGIGPDVPVKDVVIAIVDDTEVVTNAL